MIYEQSQRDAQRNLKYQHFFTNPSIAANGRFSFGRVPVISFGGGRNHTTGDCRLEIPSKWLHYERNSERDCAISECSGRMTQEQFAEMIDISVDFLSLIERGRNAPSFEALETIAKALRLPVSDLFRFK